MHMRCTCTSLHKMALLPSRRKIWHSRLSQEKRGKARVDHDSSSDDEIDDASLALMVRRTTKMLKKLYKNGVKFDGKKKKFFTSNRRKPISEMDCYNCGELGYLAHQCPKPKKDKFNKKKNKPYKKKDGKKKKLFTSTRRKPISEMDCYNCRELDHLAHQCPSLRKTNTRRRTRARKMTKVMKMKMRRRKTSHTRRRMAKRRTSTRRKMARQTSSVIGSWTLIHQLVHPMMIVTTRRWLLL